MVVGRAAGSALSVSVSWSTRFTGLSTLTMPFVDSHVTGKMSVTAFTAEPTMPCCS
jgi:hypothetical protein